MNRKPLDSIPSIEDIDILDILIKLLVNTLNPEDEDIVIDMIKKHKLIINKNLHTHPAATNNV